MLSHEKQTTICRHRRRRLSVKPGLTCLWQVSGRNQISDFREWVRLDLEYIDNWSLWLDLKILLRTIPAVLRGTPGQNSPVNLGKRR
jgi:lipopolysaccharide/colanic/teichoic acid biosynthesis glycosyltransferase